VFTEFSNVVFSPAASTETRVTSVSPIISADAVDAVRDGFRIELPRARTPGAPPQRAAGCPRTRAIGGTSVGASIATPMKTATAPMPSKIRCTFVVPEPKRPKSISPNASAITTIEMWGPKRARRDGGSTAPSRTAAIGCTRVARSAGRIAAISVTTTPTTSATTTVRVANTVPTCGRSIPNQTKTWFSSLARPRPRNSPTRDPNTPITNASSTTDQYTCRRVAPSVRRVASSRIRCATVMPIVFAITKMPTKSATKPKASRKYSRMLRKPFVSFAACFASCWPVRTCAVCGSSGRIWATSWVGVTFGLPATPIESSLPSLLKIRCAVGRSKIASVAPPSELRPAKRTSPVMRKRLSGPCASTPIESPTVKCLVDAVIASIAISCDPLGQRPSERTSGLKRWSPRGWTLNARLGAPPRETTLLSGPTSFAWSLTPPSATSTPGRPRTRVSSDCGSDGSTAPLFALPPIALLPVITASVFL